VENNMKCNNAKELNIIADELLREEDMKAVETIEEAIMEQANQTVATKKGAINHHVTDTYWTNPRVDFEAGLHVGTKEVVRDYSNQMFYSKDKYINTIVNTKDLKTIEVHDRTRSEGGWNAERLGKELYEKGAINTEATTYGRIRAELRKNGYDAMVYVNFGEGTKDSKNSMIVINPKAVKVTSVLQVKSGDELVFGSNEEIYRLGNTYPGADAAYWKQKRREQVDADRDIRDMQGRLVTVDNYEDNTFEQKRMETVELYKGVIKVKYTDGTKENYDADTGMDAMGWKHIDTTMFKGLGSSAKAKKSRWDNLDRLETESYGNVKAMQEMVEKLAELDGSSTDEEIEYYKNVLGMIPQKFYGKVKTYVEYGNEEASGFYSGGKLGLRLSDRKKRTAGAKSNAEVYVHEIIHAITTAALADNSMEGRKIRRKIEYLMKESLKDIGPSSFIDKTADNQKLEAILSKEMYEYIYEGDNALAEFIAHAVTNPKLIEKLKMVKVHEKSSADMTLYEKIKDAVSALLDMVLGNYKFRDKDKTAYEQMMDLTTELSQINSEAINQMKKQTSLGETAMNLLNDADETIGNKMEDIIDKYLKSDKAIEKPPRKGGIAYSIWLGKVLAKMMTHTEYRKSLETIMTSWGLAPEGDIQTIMRDFSEGDELSKSVDWLSLASDVIDQTRTTLNASMSANILNGFKEKLTGNERTALKQVVMDVDLGSIVNNYSNRKVRELLRDDDALKTEIGRVKHKLKLADEENYNWHSTQATGLGHYMVTNKGSIIQNLNAWNIASGVLSKGLRKPNPKVVKLVDMLATLEGLKYSETKDKLLVEQLMKNDYKGVENLVKQYEAYKEESLHTLFEKNKKHVIKGFSKSIFADNVTTEIAPLKDTKDLEARGFKKVKNLKGVTADTYGEPMGLFVSNAFETNTWHRGATRLNRNGTKGTSVGESVKGTEFEKKKHRLTKIKLDTERLKLLNQIEKGTADLTAIDNGVLPLINAAGEVVDYRYVMDKEMKVKHLGLETDVAEVLGQSVGTVRDKVETLKLNKQVLNTLKKDMKENYIKGSKLGKNDKVYVLISPKSDEAEIRELYSLMPEEFQKAARENESGGLAVRRDLMHTYFGYRHLSIAEFPGLKQVTPAVMHNIIKVAEAMWAEFIKISKVDILIKMPAVIVGNIISNVMYSIMTGTNPAEILGMYRESTRDVRAYVKSHRELVELELKKRVEGATRAEISRISLLKEELKNNPVKELADLGMYQAIVEDIDKADLVSTNKLKDMLKKQTAKLPKVVQTAGQIAYLTEETGYYKFMTEVLQMSDLVARDIENRKLKNIEMKQANGQKRLPRWWIKEKGMKDNAQMKLTKDDRIEFLEEAKKRRHENILSSFINYNKPSGKKEEYLNRMGAIMFTKYAKRIQRVIGVTGLRHPLKSLMVLLGQEFILDVETIQDQALLTRSWYNLGLSGGDMIPGTSPFERMMEVFTPPIIQKSTYEVFG